MKHKPPLPLPSQAQPAYAIPRREPNGRHQRLGSGDNVDHGVRNRWKRLRDNRKAMLALGGREDWATVLGRLMAEQEFTESEYKAGKWYGEMAGRYHRWHPPTTRIHAKSPAYQRGNVRDEEVDRHLKNGTIADYEHKASQVKKRWSDIEKKLWGDPPRNDSAREAMVDLCIYDKEVPSVAIPKVKERLGYLARLLGIR